MNRQVDMTSGEIRDQHVAVIVEDWLPYREALETSFKSHGFDVRTAAGIREAEQQLDALKEWLQPKSARRAVVLLDGDFPRESNGAAISEAATEIAKYMEHNLARAAGQLAVIGIQTEEFPESAWTYITQAGFHTERTTSKATSPNKLIWLALLFCEDQPEA